MIRHFRQTSLVSPTLISPISRIGMRSIEGTEIGTSGYINHDLTPGELYSAQKQKPALLDFHSTKIRLALSSARAFISDLVPNFGSTSMWRIDEFLGGERGRIGPVFLLWFLG